VQCGRSEVWEAIGAVEADAGLSQTGRNIAILALLGLQGQRDGAASCLWFRVNPGRNDGMRCWQTWQDIWHDLGE